jgi:hypothetical protein
MLSADSYNAICIPMFQNEPRQILEINAWIRLVCILVILFILSAYISKHVFCIILSTLSDTLESHRWRNG